ncbi:MAG: TPM domain-containing protein [Pseudoxanthomonas sp.]
MSRLLRHLFAPSASRLFPEDSLHRIADAITVGEQRHGGQVVFAVDAALPLSAVWAGVPVRVFAEEAFSRLRAWDTDANNGVLIYLLLADHHIEIVADRGFLGKVDAAQWQAVCARIEALMKQGSAEQAAIDGVEATSALIALHYPPAAGMRDNELPDLPHLLD